MDPSNKEEILAHLWVKLEEYLKWVFKISL